MANSNYSTDLATSTLEKYAEKVLRDNIFTSNALMHVLQKKGNYVAYDGGVKIVEPLMYAEKGGAAAYTGYDLLNTSATEISTNAEFNPRSYSVPVVISGSDLTDNMGEAAVMNMLKARITNAEATLKGLLNAHLYNTAVGGSDGKSLDGIGIAIDSAGTYGNISPTTDTWWAATEAAYSSDLVTELDTQYFTVSKGSTDKPDLGITTQAVYEKLLHEIDPTLRLNSTSLGDVGFESIKFRGMEVVYDEDCTSGVFYFINTNYMKLRYHKDRNFKTSPFQTPVNQDAEIAHIFWKGNLTCSARKRQAKLTGIS